MLYPLFESLLPYPLEAVAIDSQYGYAHLKTEPILVGNIVVIDS